MSLVPLIKRAFELNKRLARGPHDRFWNVKILDANKDIGKITDTLRRATYSQNVPVIVESVGQIRQRCDAIEALLPR